MRSLCRILVIGTVFIMAMCVVNKLSFCGPFGYDGSFVHETDSGVLDSGVLKRPSGQQDREPHPSTLKRPAPDKGFFDHKDTLVATGSPKGNRENDGDLISSSVRDATKNYQSTRRRGNGPVYSTIRNKRSHYHARRNNINYNPEQRSSLTKSIRNIKSMLKVIGTKLGIKFPDSFTNYIRSNGGIRKRIKNLQEILGYFEKKSNFDLPDITKDELDTGKVSKKLETIKEKLVDIGKKLGINLARGR